jgi:hypothetical protein
MALGGKMSNSFRINHLAAVLNSVTSYPRLPILLKPFIVAAAGLYPNRNECVYCSGNMRRQSRDLDERTKNPAAEIHSGATNRVIEKPVSNWDWKPLRAMSPMGPAID